MSPEHSAIASVPFMASEAFLEQLQEALDGEAAAVTIDMARVEHLDAAALRLLLADGEAARNAEMDLFLDRVRPAVYKTLQIAKLGSLFRRSHADALPSRT
jgi:anti-anti-sigma factor